MCAHLLMKMYRYTSVSVSLSNYNHLYPRKKVGETHQPTSHLTCIIKKHVSATVVKACVKIQHFKLRQSSHTAAVFTAWTFVGARCM